MVKKLVVRWVLYKCECWKWKTSAEVIYPLFLAMLSDDIFEDSKKNQALWSCYTHSRGLAL